MKTAIYVVTHKNFVKPQDSMYKPIVAGAAEYEEGVFPNYILDNTGDNISDLHKIYSEFTAIYWMWKNTNDDIIGENQYRRYFLKGSWGNYIKCQMSKESIYNEIVDEKYIKDLFSQGYNCILPKKWAHFSANMYQFYCGARSDGKQLFKFLDNIIQTKYPDYWDDYQHMLKGKVNYFKCIHIMRRELFEQMAEWMFSIYDELSKIDFAYKEREFAYLGEWMMNTWIIHNTKNGTLKIKELFFINTECTIGKHNYRSSEVVWPLPIAFMVYLVGIPMTYAKKVVKFILKKG